MKLTARWLFVSLFFVHIFTLPFNAQNNQRNAAKEEKIQQELQKIAPKAVEDFKKATVALDQQNYEESVKLYSKVIELAPSFEPAMRRQGAALASLGRREEGLKLTSKALSLNRSPENLANHAGALIDPGTNQYKPTEAELEESFRLSKEAFQKAPIDDPAYAAMLANTALYTNHQAEFDQAVRFLLEKYSDRPETHYFNSMRLANVGAFSSAEDELKIAEAKGFPQESIQPVRAVIADMRTQSEAGPFGLSYSYLYLPLWIFGAWIAGLVLLFIVGKVLSSRTISSIENSDPNDISGGGQAGLRKIYKTLITIAGIYYYVSLPFVMALIVISGLGILFAFLWIGVIPIKLMLIIALVGGAAIFYMVKSILVRKTAEDPGRKLSEEEAPELWALVRDVAKTIETRPIDEIRITQGTDLAVYERGGVFARMRDKAERVLIVGVAVLNGFNQNSFRSVIAHEYGHFSNRDTAGGDIAIRVNRDIMQYAEAMAMSGTATVYNLAFQFLRLYHFLFRRITHGATRLQEILADRVAVYQYGAASFREGLTHVIRREVEFEHVANAEINAAFSGNRAMQNLYELTIQEEGEKKDVESKFNEVFNRPTTEDDTHPSPEDRFRLTSQIKSREVEPLNGMVWDLFKDREGITKEMNSLVENLVKQSGY